MITELSRSKKSKWSFSVVTEVEKKNKINICNIKANPNFYDTEIFIKSTYENKINHFIGYKVIFII